MVPDPRRACETRGSRRRAFSTRRRRLRRCLASIRFVQYPQAVQSPPAKYPNILRRLKRIADAIPEASTVTDQVTISMKPPEQFAFSRLKNSHCLFDQEQGPLRNKRPMMRNSVQGNRRKMLKRIRRYIWTAMTASTDRRQWPMRLRQRTEPAFKEHCGKCHARASSCRSELRWQRGTAQEGIRQISLHALCRRPAGARRDRRLSA